MVAVVVVLTVPGLGGLDFAALASDVMVLYSAVYLVGYIAVTWVVFTRAPEGAISDWAQRDGRGSWLQRYVYGTAPGPGLAISMGTIALVVAVLWLPQVSNNPDAPTMYPPGIRIALGLTVLIAAWAAVVVSFTVAYHADNLLEDHQALAVPDQPRPEWSDYVYFAVSVSTTFGPTDVTVRSADLRRTVTVHSLLAFVFNTVILAAVVGFLISL